MLLSTADPELPQGWMEEAGEQSHLLLQFFPPSTGRSKRSRSKVHMSSDQTYRQTLSNTYHVLINYRGYSTSRGEEQERWVEALLTTFLGRLEALTKVSLSVETQKWVGTYLLWIRQFPLSNPLWECYHGLSPFQCSRHLSIYSLI